ncbi:MAG: hypothetical protein WDW36_006152 [Sanguina aurantia]
MLELLDSDRNAPAILHSIHTQHASFVVPMLARLLLESRDPGVAECLLQLSSRLAAAADYLPEMFTTRCLEELADASAWFEVPEGLLQLVLHLSEDPASCTVLTSLLASQDLELLHHLTWLLRPKDTATAALSQSGEAAFASATGTSMLLSVRILTAALTAVGSTPAHLRAVTLLVECAGRHIFSVASVLLLLPAPGSDLSPSLPGGGAAHPDSWDASGADPGVSDSQHAVTQLAVLQLLRVLADAGVLLDVVDEAAGRDGAASAATAQQLLAGVRSCLLQQDVAVQLAAVQLVCCGCRNAHARIVCQLLEGDLCEYLFEVLRGGRQRRQQGLAGGGRSSFEEVQALVVTSLHCLVSQEALFGRHVRCGVEPLTQLCGDSVASGNMPLAAQVMALLLLAVGHASPAPGQGSVWCQPLSMADVARIVNMVLKVFPTSSTAPGVGLSINSAGVTTLQPLPQESLSAAVSACEILRTICLQWGHNTTSMLPPLAKGVALAMTGLSAVATVSLGSADGDADISTAATCFCDSFATGGWIRLCFTTATLWPQRPDLVYQVWRVLLLTSGCINPTSSRHSNGITGRQDSGLTPENVDPTAACLVTFVRLESLLQAVASGEGCGSHAQQSHSLPHASLASITLSILRTMWEAGELPFQAAWLLSALGQVAHTLSGVAVPSDAGSSSQLLEQYVLLYIDVDRKHTGEQQHSLQLADGLPEAIQQLIAVSPHLLDLHSPFSAWLLHHAEHVPSSAVVAVKGWLLQAASEASPCQRDALQASIAEVLTGSEGLLVTLLQILQAPRQSSRDPAHLQLLCSALAVMRVGLRIQQQLASSPALQQQLLTVTRRLLLAHLPRALTAAGSAACVHAVQLLLLRLSMSPHQPSLDSLPSHQQPGEDEGECASRDRGDPESNIAGSCGWDQLDHAILLQLQTCIAKLIRRDAAEDAARDACLRPLLQVMLQLASVLVVRDCFLHHPPSGDATVTHILRDSPLWGVVRSCLAQAATSQDHAGQTSEGDTTVLELHQSPRSATACRSGHRVALPQAAVGRSGSGPNDSSCESDGLRSVGAVQQEDGDDDDHMVLAALQLQLACLVGDVVQGAPSQGTQRQRVDPAGTFRASGAQGPTSCAQGDVLQGQALLPGLSFLLSLLHILPHHAASLADASGSLVTGQSLRPAPCRAEAKQQGPDDGSTAAGWVLLECQSALEHNLLLNILLDPPPAAAPTVHQVIAQLLPTGLLHPHLTQLRAALRSHVWEESQMAKVEQSAHGTRHGAHAAAGRESDAGTLSSADQVGAPEEGRDAWTRRNTHGGGLAAGQTGGPRYEDSQYHSQSCPNKPQWDHELVTGMGADAPSGCSRK